MVAAGERRAHLSLSQARLERELVARAAAAAPGTLLVVVRAKEDATRIRRRLGAGVVVTQLHRFLARAGMGIEEEDILPAGVIRFLVDQAVPGVHRDAAREHLVGTLVEAILTLEENDVRPPYPRPAERDMDALLEAAHHMVETGLATHHAAGRFAAFERARLPQGPSVLQDAWPRVDTILFHGIDSLSPRERAALDAIMDSVQAIGWLVLGRAPDTRLHQALRHTDPLIAWLAARMEVAVLEPAQESHRVTALAHLFADQPMPPVPLAGVQLVRPANRAEEVRWCLAEVRRLLAAGVEPRAIGVVVPRLARYAEPLMDAFAEHGVACAVSYRGSLRTSPPGSFLTAVLDAVESGLERDAVLACITHPLARFPAARPQDGEDTASAERPADLDADRIEATLLERGLHPRGRTGPTGWSAALARLALHREKSGANEKRPAELAQMAGLEDVLDQLDALVAAEEPLAFIARLRDFLRYADLPRRVAAAARSAAEPDAVAAAYRAIVRLLDETEEVVRLAPRPQRGVGAVRGLLRRGLVESEVPLPADPDEGVQVLAWRNARHRVFDHVIVLDGAQDAIPEPNDRSALDALLDARFDGLERIDPVLEARRILYSLLVDTRRSVQLSVPAFEEDEPVVMSVLIEELAETCRIETGAIPQGEVWTHAEAARQAGLTGRTLAAAPIQSQAARTLVAERASPSAPGPYTGLVPAPLLAVPDAPRPLPRGRPVSASVVSQFAACAFKSYVRHGLRVKPRDVRGPDVEGDEKGDVVHKILEKFLRAGLQVCSPYRLAAMDREQAEREIFKIAVEEIEWRHRGLSWDALGEVLVGGLAVAGNPHRNAPPGLLSRFLDTMMAFGDGEGVIGTEVPFGGPDAHRENEAKGLLVVVETPAGPVPLSGTIDRIERILYPDGAGLRVVDVKTGEAPRRPLVLGGADFQLPFYVEAAQVIHPGEPVREAAYHILKRPRESEAGYPRSARYEQAPGTEPVFAALPRRLGDLLDAEEAGRFPLTLLSEAEAKCDFCELRRACGLRPELFGLRRDDARRHHARASSAYGYVPDRALEASEARGEEDA